MKIDSLEFQDVVFHYEANSPLFVDANFKFPSHENVLISGGSGSGKSALLKILAGLLTPLKGTYSINDENISEMSFEEFLPYRMKIGYSFDYGGLLANRTLWDNLMLPLQYHSEISFEEAAERVKGLVKCFGIGDVTDRRPAAVSGGMRKACVLARSFVMMPELLILDDPFVGLDREVITNLLNLIDERRKAGSLKHVFFTSRGEAVSFRLCTRQIKIEKNAFCLEESRTEHAKKVAG